ncbi:hypothetical protein FF36_06348 [Frankia torreyi]|uniref:Uncharacterized protein n=1 Tax=Frankia torreyi TaxID=1856 RepID=A0A0D8B7L9_9ACTN|nr:hypothetical protein FF36_06348 [Frankia torreyi]KQM01770.1 hypothetical protein FF86_11092 [Frankia sp. CpI1-P]
MSANSVGVQPPIVLFDVDDFLYSFSSVHALLEWYEPLMQEESNGCFDSLARMVTVNAEGGGWQARLADDGDGDALRGRAHAFLARYEPAYLDLADLPDMALVESLARLQRYAIR